MSRVRSESAGRQLLLHCLEHALNRDAFDYECAWWQGSPKMRDYRLHQETESCLDELRDISVLDNRTLPAVLVHQWVAGGKQRKNLQKLV